MIEEKELPRKSFIKYISGFTIGAGLLGQIWMFLRSIKPNVLYEPLKKFKIGKPGNFSEGLTFLPKERIFVVRKKNEFHTISAVCPHLGCTVKERKLKSPEKVTLPDGSEATQEWEFLCPCHGSKYHGNGAIYEGPAPKDLPPLHMSMAPDGNIVVDTGTEVEKSFRMKS